ASISQCFGTVDLATEAVLLAAEGVELHLPVERRGVDEGVLRGEVDATAILAQHASEVVLLRAAEILLQRHLVVVVRRAAVAVAILLPDPAVAGQVDLTDDS